MSCVFLSPVLLKIYLNYFVNTNIGSEGLRPVPAGAAWPLRRDRARHPHQGRVQLRAHEALPGGCATKVGGMYVCTSGRINFFCCTPKQMPSLSSVVYACVHTCSGGLHVCVRACVRPVLPLNILDVVETWRLWLLFPHGSLFFLRFCLLMLALCVFALSITL